MQIDIPHFIQLIYDSYRMRPSARAPVQETSGLRPEEEIYGGVVFHHMTERVVYCASESDSGRSIYSQTGKELEHVNSWGIEIMFGKCMYEWGNGAQRLNVERKG